VVPWKAVNWFAVAVSVYGVVTLILLIRLAMGLWCAARLSRGSKIIRRFNARVYECDCIDVPVTVGWTRPKILLPVSWHSWSEEKCTAVLSHERSHIERGDYLVNLLAEFGRAKL
jgi:beta-lactamase regulating signal transducer with metallopeptidase domain